MHMYKDKALPFHSEFLRWYMMGGTSYILGLVFGSITKIWWSVPIAIFIYTAVGFSAIYKERKLFQKQTNMMIAAKKRNTDRLLKAGISVCHCGEPVSIMWNYCPNCGQNLCEGVAVNITQ